MKYKYHTCHEHIYELDLINMNRRMYILKKILSLQMYSNLKQ